MWFASEVFRVHVLTTARRSVLRLIQDSMKEMADQKILPRIFHKSKDADELSELHKRLTLAYNRYMVSRRPVFSIRHEH
jgi:hypothetical protein